MTSEAKKIKEKLNRTYIDTDVLNEIIKDRLDFGFDSIYFRYSEAVEELSWFKLQEANKKGDYNFDRKAFCNARRQHFYNCLEQLLRAHEEKNDDFN